MSYFDVFLGLVSRSKNHWQIRENELRDRRVKRGIAENNKGGRQALWPDRTVKLREYRQEDTWDIGVLPPWPRIWRRRENRTTSYSTRPQKVLDSYPADWLVHKNSPDLQGWTREPLPPAPCVSLSWHWLCCTGITVLCSVTHIWL